MNYSEWDDERRRAMHNCAKEIYLSGAMPFSTCHSRSCGATALVTDRDMVR